MAVVYRFYNSETQAHFFTSDVNEKNSIIANLPQFEFEGAKFESNAVAGDPGTSPVYRLYNASTGKHLFTSNKEERDSLLLLTKPGQIPPNTWSDEAIGYHAFTSPSAEQSMPLYRFYNTKTDTHFYTDSKDERDNILATNPDYKYEDIAYYVGGPAVESTGSGTTINLTANADTPSAVSPAANTLGTVGV
jgi:hypothetical protein